MDDRYYCGRFNRGRTMREAINEGTYYHVSGSCVGDSSCPGVDNVPDALVCAAWLAGEQIEVSRYLPPSVIGFKVIEPLAIFSGAELRARAGFLAVGICCGA